MGDRIGLWNLESRIINTAEMRVSRWHKQQGDEVEKYQAWKGWRHYDRVYVFSLFDFTSKDNIPPNAICGGTGFDIFGRLPPEIEASDYDWSLYPKCDYSLIWFSTGCIYPREKHPYCVVVDKEGCIKPVEPKNLNPKGTWIKVMDNNFFGSSKWKRAIRRLNDWGQPCDFQGVDARLLGVEQCTALMTLRHKKQIKVAWDDPNENMLRHFKRVIKYIQPWKLMSYVLIGFGTAEKEDIMRVEALRKLGIDPFVMPYDKLDTYQQAYARYVNHKAIFKAHTWREYQIEYGVVK